VADGSGAKERATEEVASFFWERPCCWREKAYCARRPQRGVD